MMRNEIFHLPTLSSYEKKLLQCLCFLGVALEFASAQSSNTTQQNEDYFNETVLGMPRYGFLIAAITSSVIFGGLVLAAIVTVQKCKERCVEQDYAGIESQPTLASRVNNKFNW